MPSLRLDDVDLAYTEAGVGDPVVLIHGQGGNGAAWSAQTEELARRHRVLALDLRGHGASTVTPGPVSMERLARDVASFCERVVPEPCHVIGHSLGAMVALQLAVDAPARVRSLAVVNGAAWGDGSRLRTAIVGAVIRAGGMRTFAALNARLHFPGRANAANRRRLIEVMGACSPEGYRAAQAAVDAFDVRQRLEAISCPVLVVHSELDVIALAEKQRIVTSVRQGRLVVLPGSRHIPLWDAPDALNEALVSFLAAV